MDVYKDLLTSLLSKDCFCNIKDLNDEKKVVKMIKELEPDIELWFEKAKNDILKEKVKDNESLKGWLLVFFFVNHDRINDGKDAKTLESAELGSVVLADALLVIAILSKRKETHVKKVSRLSENQIDFFYERIETYISNKTNLSTSFSKYSNLYSLSTNPSNPFHTSNDQMEKKILYEKTVTLEIENNQLQNEKYSLEKQNRQLQSTISLLKNEIDSFSYGTKSLNDIEKMLVKATQDASYFKSQFEERSLEVETLKQELDFLRSVTSEEMSSLRNQIEILEDKLSEMTVMKEQNAKLTKKLKELKVNVPEQPLNDKIALLLQEKEILSEALSNAKQELCKEKEKLNLYEYERKKNDLERQLTVNFSQTLLETKKSNLQCNQIFPINRIEEEDDSFIFEVNGFSNTLTNINREILSPEKKKSNYIQPINENELLRQKQHIEEISGLTESNHFLSQEKDRFELLYEKANQDKEKIIITKEKLELEYSKLELEKQKIELLLTKEKLIEEQWDTKTRGLTIENENLKREIDLLKAKLNVWSGGVAPAERKREVGKDLKDKENKESKENIFKESLHNELTTYKNDLDKFKKENKRLKEQIAINEEKLDRSKHLEFTVSNLQSKLSDMVSKEEAEFYKKNYDDLKRNVLVEHEMISTNLLEIVGFYKQVKEDFSRRLES